MPRLTHNPNSEDAPGRWLSKALPHRLKNLTPSCRSLLKPARIPRNVQILRQKAGGTQQQRSSPRTLKNTSLSDVLSKDATETTGTPAHGNLKLGDELQLRKPNQGTVSGARHPEVCVHVDALSGYSIGCAPGPKVLQSESNRKTRCNGLLQWLLL